MPTKTIKTNIFRYNNYVFEVAKHYFLVYLPVASMIITISSAVLAPTALCDVTVVL